MRGHQETDVGGKKIEFDLYDNKTIRYGFHYTCMYVVCK